MTRVELSAPQRMLAVEVICEMVDEKLQTRGARDIPARHGDELRWLMLGASWPSFPPNLSDAPDHCCFAN